MTFASGSSYACAGRMDPKPARTILLIDDDPDAREAVAESLGRQGYAVDLAADGAEALARLARDPVPCVIVLDLLMPGMDGAEFLARVREDPRLADIPVVVATGIATGKVRSLVRAAAYLFKPFELNELRLEIDRLCGGSAGGR